MQELSIGSKGSIVKALQYIVGADADGIFGAKTANAVKVWQSSNGLAADGVVGPKSWAKIVANAPELYAGKTGEYVRALEVLLQTLHRDGKYMADEVAHVKTYQAAQGLAADGIVGINTWSRLFGLTSKASVKAVKPVDYKQYDSRWGNIMFSNHKDKSQTIRSSGCGATAVADVIATWWDSKITPKETAAEIVAKGYRTYNSGTAWSAFKYFAKKYKASKFAQTTSLETARGCLADGGYVVVSFGKSKWTSGGHYCCLWKDDGKYIYVNDPASSASGRAKGTYSEVRNAAKAYFCFWR